MDAKNEEEDYYDLMLVDISIFLKESIALMNVTLNSDNRGRFVAVINDSQYFILAEQLQSYFSKNDDIYYVQDINLLKR